MSKRNKNYLDEIDKDKTKLKWIMIKINIPNVIANKLV